MSHACETIGWRCGKFGCLVGNMTWRGGWGGKHFEASVFCVGVFSVLLLVRLRVRVFLFDARIYTDVTLVEVYQLRFLADTDLVMT